MAADDKRYWGTITPLPRADAHDAGEDAGGCGPRGAVRAAGVRAAVRAARRRRAVTTSRALATGIALAFARSPFETAMAAMDLDRISGGRFTLGLGTSVRSWSEGFFGMAYGKPLAHMREVVEIVRLLFAKAHTGELTRYDGKYHTLDFSELQPLSAARADRYPDLDRRAARAADRASPPRSRDGVIGHPIWSIDWATTKVPDDLKRGLDARRQAADRTSSSTCGCSSRRTTTGSRRSRTRARRSRSTPASRSTRSTSPRTASARRRNGCRRA